MEWVLVVGIGGVALLAQWLIARRRRQTVGEALDSLWSWLIFGGKGGRK